ncbi:MULTISPECIES: amidohydrolase [unclassified Oceanispirochaeta]|uniref:amidohydrolase n=1 Tax=unclassified Oceanispirochaeta TaxID=2635722 RepID=UPI000E099D67|nr:MULTISPECIES: amidohydrolase [unclassified Oceanispirochaeta]MBF9014019.1 amidohydrolase [Oceanispirochaeta sp. M2]NPD70510.1 amidohydrolase [Oceanispirochaeta sp. M1]RDG34279.1 amidohydrolase [Oceanispirochaeta sp. M1]
MKRIIIKNASAIVSCDSDDHIYKDCDILIEGPKILKIEENIEDSEADIISGKGKFIYPGLVNTHHHFFQTFVRNLMAVDYPNITVIQWLNEIYEIFKMIDSDAIYYSSLTAMTDLIKHGCTTAFDHQYCFPNTTDKKLVDRQMEAASLLGIRYHAGRGANTLPREEGSTIPAEMLETTDEFLSDCERLIDLYHNPDPFSMSQIVIAPCQPINCYKETFIESARLARDKNVLLHTHLGEGENELMLQRWGKRTLDWCEETGFIGPDVWYAHGWELLPEEYKIMADSGTGLSHCPAPATLGGFPILDIPGMQKAGMKLSLGCDGSATNDSSNLLDSLRMAYLMQCFHSKERGGSPSPYQMLKIASADGAKMMGRNDLGSLEAGKAADLFMVDMSRLEMAGTTHDPANLLARAGVTGEVYLTMINGKVVFREGELIGIDEKRLFNEAEKSCNSSIRDRCSAYKNT